MKRLSKRYEWGRKGNLNAEWDNAYTKGEESLFCFVLLVKTRAKRAGSLPALFLLSSALKNYPSSTFAALASSSMMAMLCGQTASHAPHEIHSDAFALVLVSNA